MEKVRKFAAVYELEMGLGVIANTSGGGGTV